MRATAREAYARRHRLVGELRRGGALTERPWIAAFRTVPRHVFLPRFFVREPDRWAAVGRGDDGWLSAAYADRVLVTQLDDDPDSWPSARRSGGARAGTPTCSSSMPSIMAIMLEELRVRDGMRVLEIGTGTGYNAALLGHRLGDANVSTVDIDPALTAAAGEHLSAAGHHPRVATFDGALGFPDSAPYDRVLCTCSVSEIPSAWLAQTRPGGLVVTTLNRPIGAGLVRIVAGAGADGTGRVLARNGRFMPLRAHRPATSAAVLATAEAEAGAAVRRSALPLAAVLDSGSGFEFFAGIALPDVAPAYLAGEPDVTHLVHPDGSWSRHRHLDGGHLVEQGGPRRLWDIAEGAHAAWRELGEPARERFGVTVTTDRQELWLDTPESGYRWPL